MSLSVNEKAAVRAILLAARVKRSDIEWIVKACPDVERARQRYSRSYRPPQEMPTRPRELYVGVEAARDKLLQARRSGDEDAIAIANSELYAEICIVKDCIERLNAGIPFSDLDIVTKHAVDLLDDVGGAA